jgi:hypothetical protein
MRQKGAVERCYMGLTMKAFCRLLFVIACMNFLNLSAADYGGVWRGQLTIAGARGEMHSETTLALAVNGSKLTGTITTDGQVVELLDGTINGNAISFSIKSGARDVPRFDFSGIIAGDILTLTVTGKLKSNREIRKTGEGSFKHGE